MRTLLKAAPTLLALLLFGGFVAMTAQQQTPSTSNTADMRLWAQNASGVWTPVVLDASNNLPASTSGGNPGGSTQSAPSTSSTVDARLWAKNASGVYVPVVLDASGRLPITGGTTITGGTCTNQAITAITTAGVPTCVTLTSAYVNNSIALTGTDINTSNQVTATHLASALPVNQGGSGALTLTGMVKGNGTSAFSAGTDGTDYLSPATGWTWIAQTTPTSTSTAFSSLGSYSHLRVLFTARGDQVATATNINVTFNADSGANYDSEQADANTATISGSESIGATSCASFLTIAAASAPSGAAGGGEFFLQDYRGTTFHKTAVVTNGYKTANSSGGVHYRSTWCTWRNTAAITSITFTLASGNFISGSKFTLYGMP